MVLSIPTLTAQDLNAVLDVCDPVGDLGDVLVVLIRSLHKLPVCLPVGTVQIVPIHLFHLLCV